MMPDEHFQDIKRVISSMDGHASRITLIMPLLYQSRQDKRTSRESLDCAMGLQELERYGVKELITFDAHNPMVANAIPNMMTFSNGYATSELVISMLMNEDIDINKLFIVSPDEGARAKAKFLADILGGIKYGNFDKRRDYTKIEDGKNPIVYHEFIGPDRLDGMDVVIIDDMIATGGSLLDTVKQIKDKQYLGFALEGYNFGWLANTDLGYNKFNYINLNAGAGLEVQVNKMILGVEYRYTTYKSKVGDLYEDVSFKVVNHNVSVKIGYQFL